MCFGFGRLGWGSGKIGRILLWVGGGSWKRVGWRGSVFVNGYRVEFGFGFPIWDFGIWAFVDKWESGGDLLCNWDVDNSVDKWIRSEAGIGAGLRLLFCS